MSLKDMDMMKLMDSFHSEERCRKILEEVRWPDGVACPRCEGTNTPMIQLDSCMTVTHAATSSR